MLKIKGKQPTFDECLATLRNYKFDVGAPSGVAKTAGAQQVSKYGCAAVIAPVKGQIAIILDKGYQKFIKTADAERAATADDLRSLHKFTEELRQGLGGTSLYNESMGTVSDEYMYDRVKGRTLPESQRPVPAWER
jgi:hypothetical protein